MSTSPTGIELRHFQYFVTASDLGSFRKAGMALSVRESTISRQIKDLEDKIGADLFLRHPAGVLLTATGRNLLDRARVILRDVSELKNELGNGKSKAGSIRIATAASLTSGPFREVLRDYFSAFRWERLEIVECSALKYTDLLRRNLIDIAFVTKSVDDREIRSLPVWVERVFVAVSSDSTISKLRVVDLLDIRNETLILSSSRSSDGVFEHVFRNRRSKCGAPRVRALAVGQEKIIGLVSMNKGIALTTESATSMTHPGVIYVPLTVDPVPFVTIWWEKNESDCFLSFLNAVKAFAEKTICQ